MRSRDLEPEIDALLRAFAKYDQTIGTLASHHALAAAIDVAFDILSESDAISMHSHVLAIIRNRFDGVDEHLRLVMNDDKSSLESIQIALENHHLFQDPIFGINEGRFDSDGFGELHCILKKPLEARSEQEKMLRNRLFSRFLKKG